MEDVDMDLDLGDPMPLSEEVVIDQGSAQQESALMVEELDSAETVPTKIHIRGLDDLTTENIMSFALEHYPAHQPKIEWIDDTSANLCYETPEIASDALSHLSILSTDSLASLHPLQLRASKPLSTHPNFTLQIRTAIVTDRKRPRAYESSRFYLLHPELDPREQKRQRSGSRDYRRRRYSDQEHRRRKKDDERAGFVASMYDDDDSARAKRSVRRASHSSFSTASGDHDGGRVPRSRLRNRSRSPSYSCSRSASPSNSRRRHERRRSPLRGLNPGKELFSSKRSGGTFGKELFPNKAAASSLKKELFPMKAGGERVGGILSADLASETADLFANRMSVPFGDGAEEVPPLRSDVFIEKQPELNIKGAAGFSIRGTAGASSAVDEPPPPARELFPSKVGFSIRGAASAASSNDRVRELFPAKAGNNRAKELFPERKKNKADMFY